MTKKEFVEGFKKLGLDIVIHENECITPEEAWEKIQKNNLKNATITKNT